MGPISTDPGVKWRLLRGLPEDIPSTMFFNSHPLGTTQYFSFDQGWRDTPYRTTNGAPLWPNPLEPLEDEVTHFTGAYLNDVEEITVCQGLHRDNDQVLGLLLFHSSGSRSCLGHFRWDLPLTTIRVRGTLKMRFFMNAGNESVARLEILESEQLPMPECAFDVHWKGRLEWWFGVDEVALRHIWDDDSV